MDNFIRKVERRVGKFTQEKGPLYAAQFISDVRNTVLKGAHHQNSEQVPLKRKTQYGLNTLPLFGSAYIRGMLHRISGEDIYRTTAPLANRELALEDKL